jgi:hypothetical protein
MPAPNPVLKSKDTSSRKDRSILPESVLLVNEEQSIERRVITSQRILVFPHLYMA